MNRRDFLRAGAVVGAAGIGRLAGPPAVIRAATTAPSEAKTSRTIWLNWNENPLGLAPTARRAVVEGIERANRYPDAIRDELVELLAARHGVETKNVVLGCGSTQLLQSIVSAATMPAATLVLADPTFEAMLRYQQPLSYRVERVPLDGRLAHDLEHMKAALGQGPGVVYLCNPNKPTATLTPSSEIDAWIEEAPATTLFAIDEAYFEYVVDEGYRSALHWIRSRPNVVVVRTFSKIYAMAGLRLGYAFAHEDTAKRLRLLTSLDNANALAIAAARACLEDPDLVPRSRAVNDESKRIAYACLEELGLEYIPSHANFFMHRVPGNLDEYIRRLRDQNIRVGRPFPPMDSYNRVSLGLPDEMEVWAETLRQFHKKNWV